MNYGSLFTGIRGLDLAIEAHYGAEPAWVCENDPAVAAWLARTTDVPNLGDITTINWEEVPRVDIICGGYPCQPFSHAGTRQGTDDHRHLWPYFADAVRHLRPRLVVLENVAGHLSMGFGDVLGDLAAMGYDARWGCVRAVDAGAPHRRLRIFVVATNTTATRLQGTSGSSVQGRSARPAIDSRMAVAYTTDERHERGWRTRRRRSGFANDGHAPANTDESSGEAFGGRSGTRNSRRFQPVECGRSRWGSYTPAIRRWESITGEPAPTPTVDGRLNPDLPRWMMGFPAGWLDGMTRSQQLRAAGNAVCPQQAILALDLLAT